MMRERVSDLEATAFANESTHSALVLRTNGDVSQGDKTVRDPHQTGNSGNQGISGAAPSTFVHGSA